MKRLGTILFYVLALGVAGYAAIAYGALPLGSLVHRDMKLNFIAHKVGLYTHVFASLAALALSPFQFSGRLRRTRPALHRVMGRLYLGVGVGLGGLSGLYLSAFAFGGVVAKLGFACLALCWLFTGVRAYQAIRRGAVQEHRRWVVRNVSLTLAAVALRLYLPASLLVGMPFESAYPVVAWLCWVPHLVLAEWLLARSSPEVLKPVPRRGAAESPR